MANKLTVCDSQVDIFVTLDMGDNGQIDLAHSEDVFLHDGFASGCFNATMRRIEELFSMVIAGIKPLPAVEEDDGDIYPLCLRMDVKYDCQRADNDDHAKLPLLGGITTGTLTVLKPEDFNPLNLKAAFDECAATVTGDFFHQLKRF